MVGPSSHIDIHSLTLEELAGVVNLYPWYGGAHMEMCRRMSRLGGDSWGEGQYAQEALYVADRRLLAELARGTQKADCSDKDIERLLASLMAPPVEEEAAPETHTVHVVGGDYFSQSQYDQARRSGDNIFVRFAAPPRGADAAGEGAASDIADCFATETLARIFAEQGRTEEAIRIYSRLVLDIPEKSAYFASLIDELNKN